MLINPRERYFKNQGFQEGFKEGIREGKLEIALNLLDNGFSVDEIAEVTGLAERDILNAELS